jgi:hypothetical protein
MGLICNALRSTSLLGQTYTFVKISENVTKSTECVDATLNPVTGTFNLSLAIGAASRILVKRLC